MCFFEMFEWCFTKFAYVYYLEGGIMLLGILQTHSVSENDLLQDVWNVVMLFLTFWVIWSALTQYRASASLKLLSFNQKHPSKNLVFLIKFL